MTCKSIKKLAAAMVAVIVLAGGAWAQTWDCGATPETVTATLSNGTLTISGTGDMANYSYAPWNNSRSSITSVVIEDGVTSIGQSAFSGCTGLTSVTIPNSVTYIGHGAFANCTGLTSVTIPNSVDWIGDDAFYNCTGLTSVTIGNSVTDIGQNAFDRCTGLTSVTIPNSVTSIGNEAFYGCTGLTSVTIPNSVTFIGQEAFYGCTGLTSVTSLAAVPPELGYGAFSCLVLVPEESVNAYRSADGWGGIVIQAIGASWTETWDCGETPETLTATLTDKGTLTISGEGDMADYESNGSPWYDSRNSITSVVIEDGVTSIGKYAFQGCAGLTSVTIPNSVTSIGQGAFVRCSGLTSVTIPNSVTTISSAFGGCTGLTSVTIPNGVASIEQSTFSGCTGLTSVTIGNSVTSIGSGAFRECSGLTSVISLSVIPPTADAGAFGYMSLSSVKLYVPEASIAAYRAANVWKDFQTVEAAVSVLTPTRVVPPSPPKEDAAVIAPVTVLSGEFTAGPNPVGRQSGGIAFFRQGKRVSGTLSVYDASGNVIKKITVKDNALNNQSRRKVGSWDLTDRKGRQVSEGTYLVKGVLKTSDGKSERVSVIVGVR